MSKHTPGPWSVGGSTEYINQLRIEPTIGIVFGAGDEIKANARLIAAAPEMLEALEAIIERWDTPSWKDVPHTATYINSARAVVAKAKGE